MIIQLDQDLVALIGAYEVIDSLGAVVRELAENALDAQANRIAITIYPDRWRIKMADNGMGMELGDLKVCAHPHSTSKVSSYDDLWTIRTFGFRGEALHSMAQVADLEVWSRSVNTEEGLGWRVRYEQGELTEEEIVAIAPGTVISVENIFGYTPLRRKGLPSFNQQLKAIHQLIGELALCHPQVTWQVFQNDKPWFDLSPGVSPQIILPQLVRTIKASDLTTVRRTMATPDVPGHNSTIELVMGLPDRCFRRRGDWIKIAINGRVVRLPELEQAILQGFNRTLPKHKYPVCFLHLHTAPQQIDWHRHPTKKEIYLHHLLFWQEQTIAAIEQGLQLQDNYAAPSPRVDDLLKESATDYRVPGNMPTKDTGELDLLPLQAVAQVLQTYIVVEHPGGLWLVEQHIAHERIIYEQLQQDWRIDTLPTPITLKHLRPKQIEQLKTIGVEIETFGEQLWVVRSLPHALCDREDTMAALMELSQTPDLQQAQVATACRTAIKNGMTLDLTTMQSLIDRWKYTRNPHTCPHGRPIYLSLEESSLSRFFRRNWVIGKSHGLREHPPAIP